MLFFGKENIFKCLVAFQKMLWKIFSGVWLYGWKCHFPINFSHGNSTHSSKLRQSKATTTKSPPPHHHNNNKNQNHTEFKITQRERSMGRRRDRTEARSKVRSAQCDRRGAIDWCVRSARTRARGSPAIVELDWSLGASSPSPSLSLSLSLSLRNSFEVKIGTEIHFRGQSLFFSVNWNWFPENSIFQTNQTFAFTEKHFRKWFSLKTNTGIAYIKLNFGKVRVWKKAIKISCKRRCAWIRGNVSWLLHSI